MKKMPNTHWIWLPDWKELVNDRPRLVRFRKSITLEEKPNTWKLQISADTRYKLYVNGEFVEFGPAKGDQKVWYVDTVEIAPWLCAGQNVLAMEVLRYPLAYRSGNFGMARTGTAGLFVEGAIAADETWKCREATGFRILRESPGFAPLMFLEENTAEDWEQNWKLPDYDDSDWSNARPYDAMEINAASCPGDLSPRPIPFLNKIPRQFAGVVPKYDEKTRNSWLSMLKGEGVVTIPAGQTCAVELNAGEEMCGYLSLRMQGGKGTTIRILCSEGYVQKEMDSNGMDPVKKDRCDWKNGHLDGYADIYHVAGYGKGGAEEIYEPFWFRTFRFARLEITTADADCVIAGFDYKETGYPLDVKTSVQASDPSFAGIWDISMRSLRRCMHETYEDCPFYEQLQYAMDSRSQILYTYMTSGDDRLARQCMDDFRRSQRADGMINCCYPHWGPNVIPGFSIYYILMVYDHMMFFGDRKLVKKHLGAIDGILEYFDNHLEARGIVGKTGGHISQRYWSFIDWAIPWGPTVGTPPSGLRGPITMESFLYIYGLQHAAKLCDYIGRADTAQEYRDRAAAVQKAINTYCRDAEGFYLDSPGVRDYSQHCQVFAVLTDTVPLEEGKKLVLASLDDPAKFAQCTVAAMFYLFRALEKIGAYDRTEALWDTWRNMLKNNLTTCVENYVGERSDCHAWGALLLHELPGVILGVRPGAPGFEKIEIAPVPGYLDWAEGDVVTPWGMVHVAWKKEKDKLHLDVQASAEVKERIEIHV